MPRTKYPKGEVLLLLAALASFGAPANADVLERSPDGVVHVRASDQGSSIISTGGEQVGDMQLPPEAMTVIAGSPAPAAYAAAVEQIAASNQISATLLEAVVWQESRWRPGALSPKGAIGLAQLMPGTARDLGVDPRDPHGNLAGGARYLRQQLDRFDGDLERALAAYNAGPGRVLRAKGVPRIPETQSYVRAVLDRLSGTSAYQGLRP
jgi:soluble lytic murein transglycosylase-like protein